MVQQYGRNQMQHPLYSAVGAPHGHGMGGVHNMVRQSSFEPVFVWKDGKMRGRGRGVDVIYLYL